jgi:hypothetical protein
MKVQAITLKLTCSRMGEFNFAMTGTKAPGILHGGSKIVHHNEVRMAVRRMGQARRISGRCVPP